MLEEVRNLLQDASAQLVQIETRFQAGDPAPELIEQLRIYVATLSGLAYHDLPAELKSQIELLHSRLLATLATGEQWLLDAGPELATQQQRQRLNRTYGIT